MKFGITASEVASKSSDEVPIYAAFVGPVPLRYSHGAMFPELMIVGFWPAIVLAGRKVRGWFFPRGAEPNRVVVFYGDRAELMAWPVGSLPPGKVQVLCRRAEGRSIYIGSNQLRIIGKTWIMAPSDRDDLLGALRDSLWSAQVAAIV